VAFVKIYILGHVPPSHFLDFLTLFHRIDSVAFYKNAFNQYDIVKKSIS